MKMKLLDRLFLRIGGLLALLCGGLTITAGALIWHVELGVQAWKKYIPLALVIAGAVVVLYALYALIVPRRYVARRRAFVVQATELGELRIAVKAIENLILKCVETHKEVKVQHMAIANRRGAVNVDMCVTMNSNVSIPHAVEQLQTQIKRYLAASSGIEVRDISVSVERTAGEVTAISKEPLPVVQTTEVKAEEKPVEKEQIPMHQRIFGRDPMKNETEQIAETHADASEEQVQEASIPEDFAAEEAGDEKLTSEKEMSTAEEALVVENVEEKQ